jgi:hypothetical protein
MKRINITLDEALHRMAEIRAKNNGLTFSGYVRDLILKDGDSNKTENNVKR